MKENTLEIPDTDVQAVRGFERIARYLGRGSDSLRRHLKTSKTLKKIIRRHPDDGQWIAHRADLDAYIRGAGGK
jgi:hypothetical protein